MTGIQLFKVFFLAVTITALAGVCAGKKHQVGTAAIGITTYLILKSDSKPKTKTTATWKKH